MNRKLLVAALLGTATMLGSPGLAQVIPVTNTNQSNSGAEANSGSISGAQSDNNSQNNNAGIGNSQNENVSNSASGAISGSASESTSISGGNEQGQSQGQSANNDQGQSQGQSANNTQGQGQDQGQSQGQSQDLDSSQANQQGVTVNQQWNTKNRKQTEVRTNNSVPLAASSSFSSDYCGGTSSGGVSAAPLGISIGASGMKYDKSCQSLRRAEKFGMAAVNAQNMGQRELAGRLMTMMIWSICTSDSGGPGSDKSTVGACQQAALMGSNVTYAANQPPIPAPAYAHEPRVSIDGQVSPEAAQRALDEQRRNKAARNR